MQRFKTDWILFAAVLGLVLFGLLIVYSASSIMARMDARYNSSWYFAARQAGYAVVAIVVMMALKRTNYTRLQNPAVAFSAIGVALLLLFVVYFVDSAHHRWLRLGGPVGLQPSEVAKLALVIFLASFVTWRARAINTRHTLGPAAMAVGFLIFAVVVPDLGTAVVLGLTAIAVFFVAGLQWRYCFIVAALAFLGLVVSIFAEPYRLGRVIRFFDPSFQHISRIDPHGWLKARTERTLRARDTNYQLEQSQIAVGAGGVLGVGLMNGRQKLLYLPEAHTDFIYAVAGEELGMIGTVGVLAGFLVILWRGLRTTLLIRDDFGRYLALGATVVIVVQGFVNMSVVLGIIPTKGIPLPLISYGGSSLVSTLALLGILMNVSEHAG